jgi:osmotically inducible protein OsmC
MPVRKANAVWKGSFKDGEGQMKFGSGTFEGTYSAGSRFESAPGTNPEELVGAAHAGCFSMAFSLELGNAGYTPESIETQASVNIEKKGDGFAITWIELSTQAKVPGIDEATFTKIAEGAKSGCPVSQALAGPEIRLKAKLVS